MIRRPPRSTQSRSSAASDVYKRQAPFYVVTETAVFGDGNGKAERKRLDAWVQSLKKKGIAIDGVVSENVKHASALWNLRERISVALKHAGAVRLF